MQFGVAEGFGPPRPEVQQEAFPGTGVGEFNPMVGSSLWPYPQQLVHERHQPPQPPQPQQGSQTVHEADLERQLQMSEQHRMQQQQWLAHLMQILQLVATKTTPPASQQQDPAAWAGSLWSQAGDATVSSAADLNLGTAVEQRIEELSGYIREQSQEYLDGQIEWSRQIAEVRGASQRELEKVKREKAEVERSARQELLRLRQRLRELGDQDEVTSDLPQRASLGSWAAGVGMEEHQQVQRKLAASQERIEQLQQYIKDQSAKQAAQTEARLKERDEEIRQLRQVILSGSAELQQVTRDLRTQHRQQLQRWEQGACRLLAAAEEFLGQGHSGDRGGDEEFGHFDRTAKKLSLTLSQGKEGGDNLKKQLKDALKNAHDKSTHNQGRRGVHHVRAEGKMDTMQECVKPGERKLEEMSDSNASSRDVSPRSGALRITSRTGLGSPGTPGIAHFVCQVASELRQLLAMSQPQGPAACSLGSPSSDGNLRRVGYSGCDSGSSATRASAERARVRELLDKVAVARKGVTQGVIAAEKLLRCLVLQLRSNCEELLGEAEAECADLDAVAENDDAGKVSLRAAAFEEEARRQVPLAEENQISGLVALRRAQLTSSEALAEFVQLPQRLKMVFDLTKDLGAEVGTLAQAPSRAISLSGPSTAEVEDEEEEKAASELTLHELDRGVSHEEQLKAVRPQLLRLSRTLANRDERVRSLEQEVVDLHLSRHTEREQCMALLQQTAAARNPRLSWGTSPAAGAATAPAEIPTSQWHHSAWDLHSTLAPPPGVEWPPATCVA